MKIIRVEPPKDTKYTVELNYEELRVIADSVKKQGAYYCGREDKPDSPPWKTIIDEIDRILNPLKQ